MERTERDKGLRSVPFPDGEIQHFEYEGIRVYLDLSYGHIPVQGLGEVLRQDRGEDRGQDEEPRDREQDQEGQEHDGYDAELLHL